MINREQRNGESHAAYWLRLRDELESAVTETREHIYKLTCMILDEVPLCKELEGALPIFIDRRKEYEKELDEVEDVISSLQIVVTENDMFLDRRVVDKEGDIDERP